MSARGLGWSVAGAAVVLGAFFAGIGVERSGQNPVPAAVPVVGDKPDGSLVHQVGQKTCDLRLPSGYTSDDGCPVAYGKGFRAGFHAVRDGWTIKPSADGPVLTLDVWNNNPGAVGGFWHTFHLQRYDGSLVELLWCETPPFTAGESKTVTCKPNMVSDASERGPYDEVWIHY